MISRDGMPTSLTRIHLTQIHAACRLWVVLAAGCLLGGLATPVSGQWIKPAGTGWVDISLAHQRAQTKFDVNADVVALSPFDTEAQSTVTTLRITGALGLFRGVDAWLDVPLRRQTYQIASDPLSTTGFGDTRLFLRAGPSVFGVTDLPLALALRGGVKWPTGTFETGTRALSLSQGQRDWELLLEIGRSLYPWPAYVSGWIGRRWREPKKGLGVNPGNEWVFYASAGGSVDAFVWKMAVDGFLGAPTVGSGTGTEFAARQLVQIIPTAGWRVGPGAFRARVRVPVHGQSTRSATLLSGPTVSIGYFLDWNEPLW